MPLVRVYVGNGTKEGDFIDVDRKEELADDLFIACREIVPSGMNSKLGPLAPGSIQFFPHITARKGMTVDVVVEIVAKKLKDRKNLDERADKMKGAFSQLFPDLTFVVRPVIDKSGYASDSTSPKFDGDMSMRAAVHRALMDLRGVFNFVYPADDTLENREIIRLVDSRRQSSGGELTPEEAAGELGYELPPLIQVK